MSTQRQESEVRLIVDGRPVIYKVISNPLIDDVLINEMRMTASEIENGPLDDGRRVERGVRDFLIRLGGLSPGQTTNSNFIRRPVRGTQLKEDSFATMRVVAGSGQAVPIIDAGSRRTDDKNKIFEVNGKRATDIYSNFFLQTITEERAEKQQILETFGEPFIFFFGQLAQIITFSGILLNTFDFNWEAEWWWNYDNYLRGTRCVENDARVFLAFDETLVTGYIMATAATKNAQEKNWVNFQFQMFLTSNTNFSRIGNPNA